MGKRKKITIGYKYFFGIHMGICRGPVNSLVAIKVGGRIAWQGNQTSSGTFYINNPDLFGGEKKEGGIQGPFTVMMGEPDQGMNTDLERMINQGSGSGPRTLPNFRGMLTAFYDGLVSSMSPYPKKWEFRVRRTTKGWTNDQPWYPEKALILLHSGSQEIHAMNPAHIIYECMTNKEWGRGLDPSMLDVQSFRDCADTLFEEGFGLCLVWRRKDTIDQFVQLVIDHIGGAMFTDRMTGLIKLKLIRNDYVAASVPLYTTDSGLLEVQEAVVASNSGVINQVEIKYLDPIENEERTVKVHNLAAIQAAGGTFNAISKTYNGIPTSDLALRVAQRELMMASYPLRRFKLVFDRRAWRINPGDVLRISNPERALGDLVLRVGRIEDGTLTNGRITITAVQDVFALPLSAFSKYEPPQWAPPDLTPDLKRHRTFEMPYFLLNRIMSPADFDTISNESGFVGAVAEKPTPLSTGYDLNVEAT